MFAFPDGAYRYLSDSGLIRPRRADSEPRSDDLLYLETVDCRVSAGDITRPGLAVLITEDLCWRVGMAALNARKPPPWRRAARSSWRSERDELHAERDRIRIMAHDLGLSSSLPVPR